jgi:RimJ/RimL family protein N-acetyltransferase
VLLETERLVGEPATEGDREEAVALFGDPLVAEWIWPEGRAGDEAVGPRTPEQVGAILDRFAAHWSEHGFGWWFLRERESGEFVGEVGLQRVGLDGERVVEVGWTLLPAYWGNGYATEAAVAALAHGFGTLRLDEIYAFTMTGNAASRRVMERLGMTYVRDTEREGLPHVLYRLGRPD